MTSNDIVREYFGECFLTTLILEFIIIAVFLIFNRKLIDSCIKVVIERFLVWTATANTFVFIGIMVTILFVPTSIEHKTIKPEPEVVTQVNIIEKEVIIDVPSIVLPLTPTGEQAIIIDTNSTKMSNFIEEFYGQNVNFFNDRQDATFLLKKDKFENFTGMNISNIQYEETNMLNVTFDELGFDTIWLFSDLSNINILPTKCKIILYIPYQLTEEEIEEIKSKGDITIISIEKF